MSYASGKMLRRAHGLRATWMGALVVAAALAGSSAEAQAPTCGEPGQPTCPMQAWMQKNVAAALAAGNTQALAAALDRSAKLSPDATWSAWSTAATKGAAAARSGDVAATRASCKACHDAYRAAYKAKYRMRPLPP